MSVPCFRSWCRQRPTAETTKVSVLHCSSSLSYALSSLLRSCCSLHVSRSALLFSSRLFLRARLPFFCRAMQSRFRHSPPRPLCIICCSTLVLVDFCHTTTVGDAHARNIHQGSALRVCVCACVYRVSQTSRLLWLEETFRMYVSCDVCSSFLGTSKTRFRFSGNQFSGSKLFSNFF